MPEYRDTQSTRKMTFVTLFASGITLATLAVMVVAPAQLPMTASFAILTALIIGVLAAFSRLTVTIDASGVQISFSGLVERQIDYAEIEAVEVQEYDWQEFFGWGLRWSLKDNRAVTYSLLGVPGSVRLSLHTGETVVVTVRRPKRAREVIEAHMGGASGGGLEERRGGGVAVVSDDAPGGASVERELE